MDIKRPDRRPSAGPVSRSSERRRSVAAPAKSPASQPQQTTSATSEQTTRARRPKATKPAAVHRLFSTKKSSIITGASVLVAGGLIAGLIVSQNTNSEAPIIDRPQFSTVLPGGKSITQLGGWQRVSPPKNDPVFAFADSIDSVPISVSQQPLPDSFSSDNDKQLADLAQKYSATNKLDAGGITVYVGASSAGPQSVLFSKNQLLIMIKSENKISDSAWIEYTKSLTRSGY